ncbi:aminoacyl-tRNA hydrolase [bacterium]|nr:aminoacyl-tRNA hydrolase [bacterium]
MSNKKRQQEEPKQIIVIRKDLNMPPGKLAAQVAHASTGALLEFAQRTENSISIEYHDNLALKNWLNKRFTKIVLYVKSEEKLLSVFKKAREAGIASCLITDAGFTVFKGEPTNTCIGIGPCYSKDLIGISDKLRVL